MQATDSLSHKIRYVSWGIMIALLVIGVRLFYLQIHQGEIFLTRSKKNFLRIEKITSARGNILDRNGNLLVTNRPVINMYWQGTPKKNSTVNHTDTLIILESIIQKPIVSNTDLFAEIKRANRYAHKISIGTDLSFEELSQIKERFPNHPNIIFETTFERFYPHATYASHVLGYLGYFDMDPIGKMGLEKLFEESLRGNPGILEKTTNSLGANLAQVELAKALSGTDLHTTIDISLQHIAEKIFPPDVTGSIIIMDPQDGAIRALVSRPDFDPNLFLHPIEISEWQSLQERQPFLNRALSACYPPGSIFKLVTVSAALEHGLVKPGDTVTCRGYVTFCDRRYYCNNKFGHGELTIEQAVAQSCNPLFFDIGKHMDIDTLATYAHKFGLGEKTGIIFSEKEGIVPCRSWKEKAKKEKWWPGETLSVAIGQSFLLVTPMQVARMISSIFTGFLVNPRILTSEPVVKRPLEIAPRTRTFLQETMKSVVTQGTGRRVNTVKDILVYAKTSTAQTSDLSKRDLGGGYLEHGWFVSYIVYKNMRPFTLIILLEHVGSARVATMTARNFLIEYKAAVDGHEAPALKHAEAEHPS